MSKRQNQFGNGEFINNATNVSGQIALPRYALGDGNTFTPMVTWWSGVVDPNQSVVYDESPTEVNVGPVTKIMIQIIAPDESASQYVWTASGSGQAAYSFQCTLNGFTRDPSDVAITAQDSSGNGIPGTWIQQTP